MDHRRLKLRILPLLRDLINVGMVYILVLTVDMVVSSGMKEPIMAVEFIALSLILLYAYLLREHVTKMIVYLIGHALLFVVLLVVPMDIMSRVKLVVFGIILTIADLHNWINGDNLRESQPLQNANVKSISDVHLGLVGVIVAASIFTAGRFEIGYSVWVYRMGVIFPALGLLRILIANYDALLRSRQVTKQMPVFDMLKNNAFFAGGILVIMTALMVFVRSEGLILMIDRSAVRILRVLIQKILELLSAGGEFETVSNTPNTDVILPDPSTSDSWLFRVIGAILALGGAILICWLLYVAGRFLLSFVLRKRTKRFRAGKAHIVQNEVREKLVRSESKRERKKLFFATPAEKLRYLYKKKLTAYRKADVPVLSSHTPLENAAAVKQAKGADITAPTLLYQRVRYDVSYEASARDVAALKEGFSGKK